MGEENHAESHEAAAEQMQELEQADELPKDLSDWPDGKAKYVTFGDHADEPYGEGPTAKLGPSDVEHHADGSVTVGGEPADPADFKGEPIKSGIVEEIERSKERYRESSSGSSEPAEGNSAS